MARKAKSEVGLSEFGAGLVEALKEAAAHRRGEIALPTRRIDPISAETVRSIRRKVARSRQEFERLFGIPAGTMEGWETGRRKPDLTARVLLRVIDTNPEAVREALGN